MHVVRRIWSEDQGALTFEWVALITVLVIGVVGALSAVRDGIITELGDVAEASTHVDQTFSVIGYDANSDGDYTDQGELQPYGYSDQLPCTVTQRSDRLNVQGPLACGKDETP